MTTYQSILAQASELPVEERIKLIDALYETVPQPPLDEEWLAEIERRSAEYDAGQVKGIPWEEVRANAFRRAGLTVPNPS
jgi:putative addiction module component (TIGR02574 family)